jgi:hypothetical protein
MDPIRAGIDLGADMIDLPVWDCMVCGERRNFGEISVQHRPIPTMVDRFPECCANVSYCNDRAGCVTAALVDGPWPFGDVLRPIHVIRLTAAAEDERAWAKRPEIEMLAVGVMVWLRDGPELLHTLASRYSEPDQVVVDAARMLLSAGLIEIVKECDLRAGVHASPHRGGGCMLR